MSARAIVLLVSLTAVFSAGVSFAVAVTVVDRGPAGPRGLVGPEGPEGSTEVSSDDVVSAIDEDPDSVAASLSGHLDYEDIQQNLDPDPADVQSDVEDTSSKLDALCTDLSFASALENDLTAC